MEIPNVGVLKIKN